jgi:hypothetical protein
VAVSGRYAYVALDSGLSLAGGLEVIDVWDPAHPRRVHGHSGFDASALAVDGGKVYVAAGAQGLLIFNTYQAPPRVEPVALCRDGFHLLLRGETGQVLRLERSRDLRNWTPFATVPIPASGQSLIDPLATSAPFLFYRAVSVP